MTDNKRLESTEVIHEPRNKLGAIQHLIHFSFPTFTYIHSNAPIYQPFLAAYILTIISAVAMNSFLIRGLLSSSVQLSNLISNIFIISTLLRLVAILVIIALSSIFIYGFLLTLKYEFPFRRGLSIILCSEVLLAFFEAFKVVVVCVAVLISTHIHMNILTPVLPFLFGPLSLMGNPLLANTLTIFQVGWGIYLASFLRSSEALPWIGVVAIILVLWLLQIAINGVLMTVGMNIGQTILGAN